MRSLCYFIIFKADTKTLMKQLLSLFLCLSMACYASAQDTVKRIKPPILFAELAFGASFGTANGITGMPSLNYQYKKVLFTARYTAMEDASLITWRTYSSLDEYAGLIGYRIIKDDKSFSFSVGLSYNHFRHNLVDDNGNRYNVFSKYAGVPLEFNMKLFPEKKERYRIYGLIPVTKPTAFTRSAGIKLYASLSKTSYFGLGFSASWGYHKIYEPVSGQ